MKRYPSIQHACATAKNENKTLTEIWLSPSEDQALQDELIGMYGKTISGDPPRLNRWNFGWGSVKLVRKEDQHWPMIFVTEDLERLFKARRPEFPISYDVMEFVPPSFLLETDTLRIKGTHMSILSGTDCVVWMRESVDHDWTPQAGVARVILDLDANGKSTLQAKILRFEGQPTRKTSESRIIRREIEDPENDDGITIEPPKRCVP